MVEYIVEYIVDYLRFTGKKWWPGDDPKPREMPEEADARLPHLTITRHCNMRAQQGWRLHGIVFTYYETPYTSMEAPGACIVFERAKSIEGGP